jgi:hypothetical protein
VWGENEIGIFGNCHLWKIENAIVKNNNHKKAKLSLVENAICEKSELPFVEDVICGKSSFMKKRKF